MYKSPAKGRKKMGGKRGINPKFALISFLLVLIVAFVITLVVMISTRPAIVEVPKDYVYKENISIAGESVGGMKKDEVESLLKKKESEMLKGISITIGVMENELKYSAGDLGITSNLERTMQEAMLYAQMGDNYEDEAGIMEKKGEIANFKLLPVLDKTKAKARLKADTDELNVAPVDAQVKFDPGSDEKFTFVEGKNGAKVDIAKLVEEIDKSVRAQNFGKINAPVKVIKPEYTAEEIQSRLKKIASYTSSFAGSGLHSSNRVFNIKKMAGIINGQVIAPGQTWSMNKVAGDRTEEKGWKLASGIENGVYTDQAGGGVCQVSSTLYNAALIAELEITDRENHSWPSTYIPAGLDATISTGGPDLKIKNTKSLPVYIIARVNTSKKTCTVEIYGEPPAHGYKVQMVSRIIERKPPPKAEVEQRETDQNGKPLKPGESKLVREPKDEIRVRVYKRYLDSNGKSVRTIYMYEDKYRAKAAIYYENPKQPEPKIKTE